MNTSVVVVNSARIGVVLVNQDGWADTIECLESLVHSTMPVRVVVIDAGSTDGSIDRIGAWARGELEASPQSPAMAAFTTPPGRKPLDMIVFDDVDTAAMATETAPLTVISAGAWAQGAAGANIGLQFAMKDPQLDHFWVLASDSVVEPGAAAALVMRMRATHRAGMCGTILRQYHSPKLTEMLNGGMFNPLTGATKPFNANAPVNRPFDPARIARESDFVAGASLGLSRAFIETIGLIDARLAGEFAQIDLAYRNNGRFTTGFAHGAVVYHKGDNAILSGPQGDYYRTRSRLMLTRRWQPLLLPLHWGISVLDILRRLFRGKFKSAAKVTRALFGRQL